LLFAIAGQLSALQLQDPPGWQKLGIHPFQPDGKHYDAAMPSLDDTSPLAMAASATFQTTHWSVVLAAGAGTDTRATAALETLCRAYWYPLYAFVRRRGYAPEDAQDLTQGFFARLLEEDYLTAVDPAKGRFRSFLLAAIKHFLADERDKATAQKRGGGQPMISLDARQAEDRYRLEPAHDSSPDKLFERRWALSLLSVVFERLEKDYAAAGKHELFQVVQRFLSPDSDEADYPTAARQLDMNEGAVRMAVHRLRRRYAALFREEVAITVAHPGEIEDEMRHLRRILSE
jgi:DNA-directed RNA polymerase specialized sigma24 family protein